MPAEAPPPFRPGRSWISPPLRLLRRIAGYVVLLAVLAFLGRVIYANWETVRQYEWTFDYPWLAISIFASLGATSLYIWQWQATFISLGVKIPYSTVFRIWFLANLGRYVPGKMWQFIGWFYLCEQEGVSKVQTLTSIAVNHILLNAVGIALACVVFLASRNAELGGMLLLSLALIPLGALVIQPRVMEWALNQALALVGREPVSIALRPAHLARFALNHLFCWLAFGVAFYLFIRSIHPVSFGLLPGLTGAFAGAYVIGFVTLLTPAGLGVREGALTYLLSFYLPPHVALISALLSRLWLIAAELVGVALALLFVRQRAVRG